MRLSLMVAVGLCFSLAGCAGMEDDSTCTAIDGIKGCASMADINNLVDDGSIFADNNGYVQRGRISTEDLGAKEQTSSAIRANAFSGSVVSSTGKVTTPARIGERVIVMTIFPYLDENDTYHDTQTVSFIHGHAHWSAPSVSAIRNAEDE